MTARQRGGILAFDCAGGATSAALLCEGRLVARRSEPMTQGHAERLLPMLGEILAAAQTDFAGLEAVAVTVGPGRFTGLRVGIAAARGLALATGRPAVGVGSFAAVAEAARRERPGVAVLAAIDSGRAEIFAQRFDAEGKAAGAPLVATPASIAEQAGEAPLLLAGDGAPLVQQASHGRWRDGGGGLVAAGPIDPETVARLAAAELRRLGAERPPPPRPVYLRAPDARLPRQP
jgi:tRNA threonylcarbamoyladenosine biosynthesis protein TsaB